MPKPKDIVIEWKLEGWSINYANPGFDVGDVGPEYKNYEAVVYWSAGNVNERSFRQDKSQKFFDDYSEAIAFIEEETELKYA